VELHPPPVLLAQAFERGHGRAMGGDPAVVPAATNASGTGTTRAHEPAEPASYRRPALAVAGGMPAAAVQVHQDRPEREPAGTGRRVVVGIAESGHRQHLHAVTVAGLGSG